MESTESKLRSTTWIIVSFYDNIRSGTNSVIMDDGACFIFSFRRKETPLNPAKPVARPFSTDDTLKENRCHMQRVLRLDLLGEKLEFRGFGRLVLYDLHLLYQSALYLLPVGFTAHMNGDFFFSSTNIFFSPDL